MGLGPLIKKYITADKSKMAEIIITKDIIKFLKDKEFINVGTCDFDGRPNVAPKFLLKIENDYIYLADYIIGRTWRNIKINPKVSLSTMHMGTLTGYQMNGQAEIVTRGVEYKKLVEEYREKQIRFSVARVIEGVRREKKHENFELAFPKKVVIFKIKVEEIVEIIPSGELRRKKHSAPLT